MKIKNYYQILEIDPFVSQEQIRMAYNQKLKEYHPDQSANGQTQTFAHKRFQAVLEAYEAIKTPERRAQYDQMLKIEIINERSKVRVKRTPKNDNKRAPKKTLLSWITKSFQQKQQSNDSLF